MPELTPLDITIGGVRLEAASLGDPARAGVTLVMLHEGLGCVAMWGRFPQRLAALCPEAAVFAYSRAGYGGSDPVAVPRPLDYMEREARDVLPHILDDLGARDVVLVGHSDGGTIAACHAGWQDDARIRAAILIAPHFFNEPTNVAAIKDVQKAYEEGDLRRRLARYHGDNVDCAFWGWNKAWLDPAFLDWSIEDALPGISAPLLVVQGAADPYGTLAHAEAAKAKSGGPVELAILDGCGHSPFREAPEETDAAIAAFLGKVLDGQGP